MISTLTNRSRLLFLFASMALLPRANAQSVLIDTGAGGTSSIGANGLLSTGGACSPEPTCGSAFQFIAAQFTLTQAATLDSVQFWAGPFGSAGSLTARIRSVNPQKNGLPGDTQPPYLGAVSIYEHTYALGNTGGSAGWVTLANFNPVLAAGTYWLALEPVSGSGLQYTMPGGVPTPLEKYAYFGNGNPGYLYLPTTAPNQLGIRILGTNFPGYAFGTMTRSMLTNPSFDTISGGNGQALDYHWIIDLNGHGGTFAVGRLNDGGTQNDLNGLSAGAYAVTCWSAYGSPCSQAGGRGLAYRTFINSSTVAKTFRINASLVGGFFGTGATSATGAVYAFNTTGFAAAINNSGFPAEQYLLQRDSLAELSAANSSLSLVSLFPGQVLTSAFVTPIFAANQVQTTPLTTGFITVNPQETFTLMFDVTAYSGNGGSANFADTLVPAANFFTDANGIKVPEIIAVGPPAIPSKAPTSLVLSPASATNPLGTTHTVTATATDSTGAPVPNATVFFNITAGPNTGQPGPVVTDANGQATFAYTSSSTGTDSIQANIKSLQSNVVQATWEAGVLDHITINPTSATITAGGSQAFTAEAFDSANNSLGVVTATTTFGITPNGSCTNASCTANIAGAHTVTATYNGKSANASLTVNPGSLDHITITPSSATIPAGGSQAYTTEAFDVFNNNLGTVTATTTFGITPNGSCTNANCTASVAGAHTVTATYNGKSANASLTVSPGAVDRITIAPTSATIAAGGSQAFTTQAFDSFNNSLGSVTIATTFGITPDGSCTGANCTASIAGPHTVTGTYSGKSANASLTVTSGTAGVCPQPQGFWKNNPNAWKVSSLTLGSQLYSKPELLQILGNPGGGDASQILALQLIAAKLNIANGSNSTPANSTISTADGLLAGFAGKLPYKVKSNTSTGQSMTQNGAALQLYNSGQLTPGCTP